MDKLELLHNTLVSMPALSGDSFNEENSFIKFLLNKYDEDVLESALKNVPDDAIYFNNGEIGPVLTLDALRKKFA